MVLTKYLILGSEENFKIEYHAGKTSKIKRSLVTRYEIAYFTYCLFYSKFITEKIKMW